MRRIEYVCNKNGLQHTNRPPYSVRIRKKFFRSNRSLKFFQKPLYCYIRSTPINSNSRKLEGKWTVEIVPPLIAFHSPLLYSACNMEQELICEFDPNLLNKF